MKKIVRLLTTLYAYNISKYPLTISAFVQIQIYKKDIMQYLIKRSSHCSTVSTATVFVDIYFWYLKNKIDA